MTSSSNYSLNELMVVAAARELRNGDLIFVGVGTAGRAFTMACGIPIAAARLAQETHAPDLAIYWNNLLSPDLQQIPERLTQHYLTTWPTAAQLHNCSDKNDMLSKGRFDVSFDSAPQIDRYGNLNITAIGDYRHPKRRLIGALAQTDHFAYVRRPLILTDLKKRTFVEKVDFITSVGYLDGGNSRAEAGLRPGGPSRVITDKAIFGFHDESREMELLTVHESSSIEEVVSEMGFLPRISDNVSVTVAPTEHEIRLIRDVIDPRKILLVS
ncbi:CoA-transferase subunit beta [Subtercola lobariae]|uniref:3-oxoadipate--succinyl-CoA transferase subunit B n=1 Tax=Subtercola lobariae TaxID=1588641 RepID=A0A917B4J1_9MICO|nr:CoA-transferase [Subtercola lobariae]GGF18296.1 3-oxoadipate--succinyl-CoA transferase subunit B [Subtercola lobariae]